MGKRLGAEEVMARKVCGAAYYDSSSLAKQVREVLVKRLKFSFECTIFVAVMDGTVAIDGVGSTVREAVGRAVARCDADFHGRRDIGVQYSVSVVFENGLTLDWPAEIPKLEKLARRMNRLCPDIVWLQLSHNESVRLWRSARSTRRRSCEDDEEVANEFVTEALRAVLAAAKFEGVDIHEWIKKTIAIS